MKMKKKRLIICLAIPLAVGAVSGFITRNSMAVFRQLKKPPFSPPGWIFPIVWTILFIMMGFASYLILAANYTRQRTKALTAYIAQLAVNFFWPIFFFKFKWFSFSFFWLILLWVFIIVTIKYFYNVSQKAAYFLIPYIIWISYAGYLNLFISILN
ncbi:MAG: tryptophan-rich sensory protein [Clostridiaceae bacterium]|nr:tryptophan-rich sensory protein [Clostridiaceae bacterium]